jgi:NADH-quinone oxidoreductase subunit J
MIGAIVLTLRDRGLSRRQDISRQIARTAADTMEMVDAPIGAGVATLGIRRPKVSEPQTPQIELEHHDHPHGDH